MPNPLFEGLDRPVRKKPPKKRLPPSHTRAKVQEKEVAKAFQGRLTPASGSRGVKGAVRIKGVCRIECKTTTHRSFSVTLDMIRKIEEAALSGGEMPAIIVEFNNGAGRKIAEVAVVPTYAIDLLRTP